MESLNYFWIFFIFFPICLAEASLLLEEENSKKLIAVEDKVEFFKQLGNYSKGYGEKWIAMPDGNGTVQFATLELKNSLRTLAGWTPEEISNTMQFFLYTAEEKDGVRIDLGGLDKIKFNPSYPTKIIVHGWMAGPKSSVVQNIKNAYLSKGNLNIIAIDWSTVADNVIYPIPVMAVSTVGRLTGEFINDLVETHNARYSDFHLIGHSLGAHVSGFAVNTTKEKIGRLTGLDPALPGFEQVLTLQERLDESDANFVDVIHTCSGLLGISTPSGHVDFYPNGGTPFQPGCSVETLASGACSHSRSHEYFAESISNKSEFIAVKCQDWEHFKRHQCEEVYAMMGEHISQDVRGIFYLTTKNESPFWEGLNGTIF